MSVAPQASLSTLSVANLQDPSRENIVRAGVGFAAWSFDPAMTVTLSATTGGVMRGCAVPLPAGLTVRSVVMLLGAAATGAVPTLVRVGVYNPQKQLVAATADVKSDAQLTAASNVFVTYPLATPYVVPSNGLYGFGYLEVGAWGGTAPTYLCALSTVTARFNYAPPFSRCFQQTGLSDLPATAVPVLGTVPLFFACL
jgi:hypothetical protein